MDQFVNKWVHWNGGQQRACDSLIVTATTFVFLHLLTHDELNKEIFQKNAHKNM